MRLERPSPKKLFERLKRPLSLLLKEPKWKVALLDEKTQSINIVKAGFLKYFADPFLLINNQVKYCFVEEFNLITGVGKIAVLQEKNGIYNKIGYAIEEKFHSSFPFVFRLNQEIYMCAETSSIKQIRFYRMVDNPLKWELAKVVASNIEVVDTIVVEIENKWLLITSSKSMPGIESSNKTIVYSFSNNDPEKSESITEQKNNLVSGRNGGLIINKDNIFRIRQTSPSNIYGDSIEISKIDIDKNGILEESSCLMHLIKPKYIKRVHHVSNVESVWAIDFTMKLRLRNTKNLEKSVDTIFKQILSATSINPN